MTIQGRSSAFSAMAALALLTGSLAQAGTMGPVAPEQGKLYVGAFGGGGSLDRGSLYQNGTAFFTEAEGGPLAVDAFGRFNSNSVWVAGGHIGYLWPALMNSSGSSFTLSPAAELEGFYIGGNTLTGHDLNNNTTRLPEHDFLVTYPADTGVFLVNSILNINHASLGRFHPYAGLGAGLAVISISGATSTQMAPPEAGLNHYNAGQDDTNVAFAAQPKVGVSVQFNPSVSLFAEYRFIYLSATGFTFGSTVYPNHAPTTSWNAKIGSQYYNLGTVGIQFDV